MTPALFQTCLHWSSFLLKYPTTSFIIFRVDTLSITLDSLVLLKIFAYFKRGEKVQINLLEISIITYYLFTLKV